MQTVTSTEIQNKFGEYLDRARLEPIEIMRNGRTVAIMVPPEEFKTYQAFKNEYWIKLAREGEKERPLPSGESYARLKKRLDELDNADS